MGKFLINPVKAFQQIKDNYTLYVETAFGTRFSVFNRLRKELLNKDRVFYREPWIELLPQYKSNGLHIRDLGQQHLPGMDNKQRDLFKNFIRKGLIDYDDAQAFEGIYTHQEKMLKAALSGKNCVITSGTGSGKTESFLLPLIAQIVKETPGWAAPGMPHPDMNRWWTTAANYTPARVTRPVTDASGQPTDFQLNPDISQRAHETRPAAVRALILYPMNALVEDQMTRLRQALDADEVKNYLDTELSGNRIYFGRYNSSTPVAGKLSKMKQGQVVRNEFKIKQLKAELNQIEENMQMVEAHLQAHPELNRKEVLSIFQRLYGATGPSSAAAEMRSRFDMQIAPPDILITNYSMLGIMLMREIDDPIFTKTREWLESDPSNVFHLIIDELHLYRGTPGTEISYLVRLLINRLGLTPDSSQLRILASSASLDDNDPKAKSFLKEFFGITSPEKELEIIKGESDLHEQFSGPAYLPADPFAALADLYQASPLAFEQHLPLAEQTCQSCATQLAQAFQIELAPGDGFAMLCQILNHSQIQLASRIDHAFTFIKGHNLKESRAIALFPKDDDRDVLQRYFSTSLFGENSDWRKATEGLIIARGLFDIFSGNEFAKTKLQRFRFHYFFRNIEGLWATAAPPRPAMPVGNLHGSVKITDERDANKRVFELLYCESCGTVFYGGKRLRRRQGHGDAILELVATSPKIEGLPEQTVQVLVERRSYADFAIFWPTGHEDDHQHYDMSLDQPENPFHRALSHTEPGTQCRWYWRDASLDMYSGDVLMEHAAANDQPDKFIKGYLFQVEDLDDEANKELATQFQALPCTCPHCATDRFWAKKRKSPIRGFRAGFSKTSQIFAKELFYQLPEAKGKPRKLVSFSDSREDAATIANGIERNHYQDLLRDEMIKFGQSLHGKTVLINRLRNGETVEEPAGEEERKLLLWAKSLLHKVNDPDETAARPYQEQLSMMAQGLTAFQDFYRLMTGESSVIIKNLYELGLNPAGCDWEDQSFEAAPGRGTYEDWPKCFTDHGNWSTHANASFRDKIETKIKVNLGKLLFGRLFYGLESSAFGWSTVKHTATAINGCLSEYQLGSHLQVATFTEIVDSVIRILGEGYRRTLTDRLPDESPYRSMRQRSKLKKYIRAVSTKHSINEPDRLGEAVTSYLQTMGHRGLILRTEDLHIRFADALSNVFECEKCKRIHLHPSAGVCTFCQAIARNGFPPSANQSAGVIWQANYLATGITQQRLPVKLHCEELTGQTDDQFERQRHFRDYIFEAAEGPAKIRSIDLLSVTTTLEVGVDIGALQAVMLANMPPQRFNYQQRVGRGGRRGQAYSLILTLCRGRSHDEYYFANPHRITGDAPPTPFLSTGQEEILKRMLVKELLRLAFKEVSGGAGGTHGEFGSRSDWENREQDIIEWFEHNRETVDHIILLLNDGDRQKLGIYRSYVYDALPVEINVAVENDDIAATDLSETLAEAGLLPMFGMPSRVRVMYAGLNINKTTGQVQQELSQVDRPLDVAITEFFPGGQKTKDKKIITSIGFTPGGLTFGERIIPGKGPVPGIRVPSSNPFTLRRKLVNCTCRSYFKTFLLDDPKLDALNNTCPNCFAPLDDNIVEIRTPAGFRTDFSPGENSEEDTQVQISRPSMFAEARQDVVPSNIKNAQVSLSQLDTTWRINDQLLTGRLSQTVNNFPFFQNARLENQWIANLNVSNIPREGYQFRAFPAPGSDEETIKIAANKATNVFRIKPNVIPPGINLNPFDNYDLNPSALGVKAAYYSAAFILQRALAAKQDVDPTEIEISDIISVKSGDHKNVAQIILADELANGSGFVKDLFKNLDQDYNYFQHILEPAADSYFGLMLSDAHRSSCKDACYECLKVYRNMPYHGLIDWRLGMGLLRLLYDPATSFGLQKESLPPEMADWRGLAEGIRDSFLTSFYPLNGQPLNGVLPGILVNYSQPFALFFLHPFWERDAAKNALLGEAVATSGVMKYKVIDTFNALRRPGWCYENIG